MPVLPQPAFQAPVFTDAQRRAAFDALMRSLPAPARLASAERWLTLQAAHVVGQTLIGPHLRVHAAMFVQAASERDVREMTGQLFRLALVPLGHLTGRLPLGNPGRAEVSAFQPMAPSAAVARRIEEALGMTLAGRRRRP